MVFLIAFCLWSGAASSSVYRLTGTPGFPMERDFGDPSTPDFSDSSHVRVYTTGGDVLIWTSDSTRSAKNKFLEGAPPRHERLVIAHHDGFTLLDELLSGEDAWDPTVEYHDGQPILYAGVMSPRPNESNAFWPEDHWSRRTFAFDWRNDRWVMRANPVFGKLPTQPQWLGHNYGHHVVVDDKDRRWMFYERVSEERHGRPYKTELFARRLNHSEGLVGKEVAILKIPSAPWTHSVREDGTLLIEGPRVLKFADGYLLSFSAGDYFSDHYGIHLAWSKKLTGPYKPYLNSKGNDLKNFATVINKQIPMTWGPARAAFFVEDEQLWMLFHGIEKASWIPTPDGKRDVYLAPMAFDQEHGRLSFAN